MEETETTIHAGLMRRNNFLRENPNFFTRPVWSRNLGIHSPAAAGHASQMTEQEPERSV
jgi:hypothetical protein